LGSVFVCDKIECHYDVLGEPGETFTINATYPDRDIEISPSEVTVKIDEYGLNDVFSKIPMFIMSEQPR
jgi:hypothetical protein